MARTRQAGVAEKETEGEVDVRDTCHLSVLGMWF